jgi:AAA family ATP:ADP antiporter
MQKLYPDQNNPTWLFKIRNSSLRHTLWPIRSSELKKFVPMALLMFTVLFNYNVVRGLKDSIVMTMVGPEVISFIKLWAEMPAGVLFVIIYAKMCNRMSTEKAFRYIVSFFLIFFMLFAFVLFPMQEKFHPDPELIKHYIQILPNLKWFVTIWGKWSFVVFYVMVELWPVIVCALLFWQLANKITSTEESTRFYSFFSFFGQANLLISGTVIVYFASDSHCFVNFFDGITNKTELTVKSLMLLVGISGIICLILHYFIERKVMAKDKKLKAITNKTLNLGILDSAKVIISSKYLWLICVLMISYATAVNLIEGLWFSKARELYPEQTDFMSYMGRMMIWLGGFVLLCSLLGSTVIRRFGWFCGAIITPIMTIVVGSMFFTFAEFQDSLPQIFMGLVTASPLMIIVFIGALQNVLLKGVKYSIFDATKEMVYIPLDDELKTKGKAAVDVIGTKIGKSLGAFVQFITFTIFPGAGYNDIIIFLLVIFVIICVGWIFGVASLSRHYKRLLESKEPQNIQH